MTDFYFNHDPANLPDYSEDCHPVQLFHTHLHDPNRHSLASKQLLQTVRGLGINIDEKAIDLITLLLTHSSKGKELKMLGQDRCICMYL